jgi:hypothetical protein
MSYAHCIVDFSLPINADHDNTIDDLDTCCFSNGIIRYEILTAENEKHVRLHIMLRIHDPFWKLVHDNKTHEVTISYDDTELLAKAYNYADAPEL